MPNTRLYAEDLSHRKTDIHGKREHDYDYQVRHVYGYPKTGFEKEGPGAYPTKKEAPTIKEGGDVLGQMVQELVQKQEEIDAIQEEIKAIEAEAETKKSEPRKRQAGLRGEVADTGRKVFGMLAKSVENLEVGAAHFRRVQNIIIGIRESYEEKTQGKLSPSDKNAKIVEFLKANHSEVMAEVDEYLDNITSQLITISETPRQVVTQKFEARRLTEGIGSWLQGLWGSLKQIFANSGGIASAAEDYSMALQEML